MRGGFRLDLEAWQAEKSCNQGIATYAFTPQIWKMQFNFSILIFLRQERQSLRRNGKDGDGECFNLVSLWRCLTSCVTFINRTWFRLYQPLSESTDNANGYDPALATQYKSSLTYSRTLHINHSICLADKRLKGLEVIYGHYQPLSTACQSPKSTRISMGYIGSVMMKAISHIDLNTIYIENFVL